MKFFDIGQEAHGFIAIGQLATGVIAIGQMATGVIAIGQVARGFFAVGMLAYGCVSVGMLGIGVFSAVGMLGASALGGKGLVLPLMPFPRDDPFSAKKPADIFERGGTGFVRGRFVPGADQVPRFESGGRLTDARIVLELTQAARAAAASTSPWVLAYVNRMDDGTPVVTRAIAIPGSVSSPIVGHLIRAIALAALTLICVGFYALVAEPLLEFLVSSK